ncbi:hypothetical protein RhiirB3_240407 [Rhizophagus irregularis]|nr:hypothetical protein RhiirB3_240407 [Rhizophagus irregularis]
MKVYNISIVSFIIIYKNSNNLFFSISFLYFYKIKRLHDQNIVNVQIYKTFCQSTPYNTSDHRKLVIFLLLCFSLKMICENFSVNSSLTIFAVVSEILTLDLFVMYIISRRTNLRLRNIFLLNHYN